MQISQIKKNKSKGKYKITQDYKYTSDDYWTWSVWIEAKDDDLDKIENVIYNLHYTFNEPVKLINTRNNKFRLDASGWGTFTIYARLNFKDSSVLELEHELELFYPSGDKSQA